MSEIKEILGKDEFLQALKSDKPVLVDFWATWCGPCKMQAPILYEFSEEVGDKVDIIKVDVDQNEDIAAEYDIMSIPTLFLFKDMELKEKSVGLTSKAGLSEMVIKHI